MGWYGSFQGANAIRVFVGPAAAGTTGVIDWGDGNTDPLSDGGNQEIHHNYGASGSWTLQVTDASGGVTTQQVTLVGTRPPLNNVSPRSAAVGGPDLDVVYQGTWDATRQIIWDGHAVPTANHIMPATGECKTTIHPSEETAPRRIWTGVEDSDGMRSEPYYFDFTA